MVLVLRLDSHVRRQGIVHNDGSTVIRLVVLDAIPWSSVGVTIEWRLVLPRVRRGRIVVDNL
jgi:hypothetical protein